MKHRVEFLEDKGREETRIFVWSGMNLVHKELVNKIMTKDEKSKYEKENR